MTTSQGWQGQAVTESSPSCLLYCISVVRGTPHLSISTAPTHFATKQARFALLRGGRVCLKVLASALSFRVLTNDISAIEPMPLQTAGEVPRCAGACCAAVSWQDSICAPSGNWAPLATSAVPLIMQAAVELQRAVEQITGILQEKEHRYQGLQRAIAELHNELHHTHLQEVSPGLLPLAAHRPTCQWFP